MFGSIGGPEILLILVLALLLFGPRKLPEIGRTLARTISDFRRATYDFRSSLEREIELDKVKEAGDTLRQVGTVVRNPLSVLDDPGPGESAVKTGGETEAGASASEEPPAAETDLETPGVGFERPVTERPEQTAAESDSARPGATMGFLDHLDELRSRLFHSAIALLVAMAVCWGFKDRLLAVLLQPIRDQLFEGGEIVMIHLTEAFTIYMKASFLFAIFVASPYLLYQLWAFVAPGLYRNERRLLVPFLLFGTLSFVGGGVFGYAVATPVAAGWLIELGSQFTAQLTVRSAFQFQSRLILGMGAVFEMPVLIALMARLGVVTPAFLWRHLRIATLVITVVAAVLTPTGDMMTLLVFAGPMVLLYLIGIFVAWVFQPRDEKPS